MTWKRSWVALGLCAVLAASCTDNVDVFGDLGVPEGQPPTTLAMPTEVAAVSAQVPDVVEAMEAYVAASREDDDAEALTRAEEVDDECDVLVDLLEPLTSENGDPDLNEMLVACYSFRIDLLSLRQGGPAIELQPAELHHAWIRYLTARAYR